MNKVELIDIALKIGALTNGANMPFLTEGMRLDTGDLFPEISFKSITGYSFELPDAFKGSWCVLLIYRGGW